jgi:glyoxylase-like metal-dependent hydrolase (beta-lactamase superfamily II)
MEEIANQVFIEQCYPGVVSSVLKLKRGLVIIDGPCRAGDRHAWGQKIVNLGGGIGKMVVLLDTHTDRLSSLPLVEAPILAQENAVELIQDLPIVSRPADKQPGADPDDYDLPYNNRWPIPDITYSQQVNLFWDDQPVIVTHQPGAHLAGSWVRYDAEKVIFVGDSVVSHQPPFLAWCQIDHWIEELTWLSSDFFKYYQIISGRDGVIGQESVVKMLDFLQEVKNVLGELARLEEPDDEIAQRADSLLTYYSFEREMKDSHHTNLVGELKNLIRRAKSAGEKGELNASV